MHENPYKYRGPLDPVEDELVCVPRTEELNKVIEGLKRGDYWSILGPRQIGKTTFLRQVMNEYPDAYHIYVSLQIIPSKKEARFYTWLRDQVLEKVPHKVKGKTDEWDDENPGFSFMGFLERFSAKDDKKKIVFLFDEIDKLPFLGSFLTLWREIFHNKKAFDRYAVAITGSVDLITLSTEPTSPFNISEILYLKDFTGPETKELLAGPFNNIGFKLDEEAERKLMSQLSGHPQMVQHACHTLYERAGKEKRDMNEKDVDDAIKELLRTNTSLDLLRKDMNTKETLLELVKKIIKGEEIKFHPHKEFSVLGAGAIIEENSYCKIRNEIYLKYIVDSLENAYKNESNNKKEGIFDSLRKFFPILGVIGTCVGLVLFSIPGFIGAFVLSLICYFILKEKKKITGKKHV